MDCHQGGRITEHQKHDDANEEYVEEIGEEVVLVDSDTWYAEDDDDDHHDNAVEGAEFLTSIRSSTYKHFLNREATGIQTNDRMAESTSYDLEEKEGSLSLVEEESLDEAVENSDEGIYEEQIIEKWFRIESIPDDLENACRQLIPIVYKGEEHADPEIMMRRTPLHELYKYLKQHYDFRRDVKKDISYETERQIDLVTTNQSTLGQVLQRRCRNVVANTSMGESSKNVTDKREPGKHRIYDAEDKGAAEEEYFLENLPKHTYNLKDVTNEYDFEEIIMDDNSKRDFGESLPDFGDSTKSYFEEELVENWTSTRSFIEEEIIEETEVSHPSLIYEEIIYTNSV